MILGTRASLRTIERYLSVRDGPERFDKLQLGCHIRSLLKVLHGFLNHLCDGLLQLAVFLRENDDILLHKLPVMSLKSQLNEALQDARAGGEICRLNGERSTKA